MSDSNSEVPESPKSTVVEPAPVSDFDSLVADERQKRDEQDAIWRVAYDPDTSCKDINAAYSSILIENVENAGQAGVSDFKKYMLNVLHNGDISNQGCKIHVPLDFHKGPFLNTEDEYFIIYGDESKIYANCNSGLIQTIGNTEITHGMKNYGEGVVWANGLICYNSHSIVVRNADNTFGQPGFLSGFMYNDRLGIEIMKRYVVTDLINNVNSSLYTQTTDPDQVFALIRDKYQEVRNRLVPMLSQGGMNEILLFADAPIAQEIAVDMTDSDRKIAELEKRVAVLEQKLEAALRKIEEVEDIALDASIAKTEKAIIDDDLMRCT